MRHARLIPTTIAVAAAALSSTLAAGTPAHAGADTTPPTVSILDYAEGYHCGTLITGSLRSTDNVTPQSQIRYEVFADGKPIGPELDQGDESGVWAWFQNDVLTPGLHTITVKAEDLAGNWSAPSNADVVTGYAC